MNNAGTELNKGVADATEADWDTVMATNARGLWLCLREELRRMRPRGGGAIVNTNSVSGFVPTQAQAIYGASKRMVTHLTRSAAREGGKDGVRVNEILPALLMSEMVRAYFDGPDAIPLQPWSTGWRWPTRASPRTGRRRRCSCVPSARYITGASLPVDGGFLLYNAGAV